MDLKPILTRPYTLAATAQQTGIQFRALILRTDFAHCVILNRVD
jgi:hypothetical protein